MRVAIYTRVSLDRRSRNKSVTEQETECRGCCDVERWTVARVFSDNSLSASRFARKEREEYQELLDFLKAGAADALMLWEASRGGRELEGWVKLLKLCRTKKILIHIVTHERTYDMSRPKDFKTLAEEGVDSAYQSEETSLRVSRHMRSAAAEGRPHGKLLFGFIRQYDSRGNFLAQVEHPEQAAVIREAAKRVATGEPCNSVAVDFNNRGISAPRGGKWDLTQIRRLVSNPAYVAQRVHQGVVVGEAKWDPILDHTVYSVCTARMSDPSRRTQRNSALKHLLSGVARCGVCDGHMRVQKNRGHYAYLCEGAFHVSVKTTSIEEFITALVLARMARPDIAELFRQPDDTPTTAATLELSDAKAQLEGFYEQAAEGKISPTGLAKVEAKLLPRIAELEKLAQPLAIPPTLRALATPDPAKVWANLAVGQQREVIQLLMEVRVNPTLRGARTFDPQRVAITWRTDA